jgi:protoheme IX farnesyltransferase
LLSDQIDHTQEKALFTHKIADVAQLIKLRLATLVVMSAAFCYIAGAETINWSTLTLLVIGGFLVTGSSNGFNQIIEKDLDKLMDRTKSRPVAAGRMGVTEAFFITSAFGVAGIVILYFFINPLSGILGALALVLYTLVYTPLKRKTPFAVFVGAFPGAIPAMLGWVAARGQIDIYAWILFACQFMWQFPHFWAIAWVLDDDYKKAGFKMLPSVKGRDKSSSFQVLVYTLFLIPVSLLPVAFRLSGSISGVVILLTGIWFLYKAYKLYSENSIEAARKLMFASFIYLPVVQMAVMFDKI